MDDGKQRSLSIAVITFLVLSMQHLYICGRALGDNPFRYVSVIISYKYT